MKVEIKGNSELVIKQITREYKCINENMLMNFAMEKHLLECFEVVTITHVPRMENQEANDLEQIASGYKVSKDRLKDFIEVKENMASNVSSSPKWQSQNMGAYNFRSFKFLKILKILKDVKFLPLKIRHSQIGENQS